jgi:hypothetical protein
LKHYKGSHIAALKELYPEVEFQKKKFGFNTNQKYVAKLQESLIYQFQNELQESCNVKFFGIHTNRLDQDFHFIEN